MPAEMNHSPFWWSSEKQDGWKDVIGYVRGVEESQKYQRELNIRNARLYANSDVVGIDQGSNTTGPGHKRISRVVENVIQSVCDTATSMIAKNRPRATFTTDGADWSLQRRAMLLEKFIEGQFSLLDVYKEGVKVFRDAVVFGTGAMKIYADAQKIVAERVLIDEILVDEREARSSSPRQLHQRKLVNREVLKAMFPDSAEDIERANLNMDMRNHAHAYHLTDHDNVWVVESWHLPSSESTGDGVHCICIEGVTLLWEKYEKSGFPFVFYRWSEPLTGFYGQGLAEQLTGIQLRINKINNFIQRAQDLIAVPRVFVDVASKQLKLQIDNDIGGIIPYRGKPPVFMTAQAVSGEIYAYKEQLKRSAYELAGISQLSATAQKPAGLESAVALREYNDIETQRFAIQAQAYEQMFLEVAYAVVALAKEIYSDNGYSLASVWRSNDCVKRIEWKDVDMEEAIYVMQIQASSILSRTPAGRMQQVIEMAQAGLIDKDEARALLQHPDLQSSMDLFNAMIRDVDDTIEQLYEGEFPPPEPFQNLQLALGRVQMAYLKAKREKAPEDVLTGMRQWLGQAKFEIDRMNQELQMQQMAMMQQGGAIAGTGLAGGAPALGPAAMGLRAGTPRTA